MGAMGCTPGNPKQSVRTAQMLLSIIMLVTCAIEEIALKFFTLFLAKDSAYVQ